MAKEQSQTGRSSGAAVPRWCGEEAMSGGASVYPPLPLAGAGRAAGGRAGARWGPIARSSGYANVRVPVVPPYGQKTNMAREWPLRSFLELGAYPGAVPCARLHAKAVMWEWGFRDHDTGELVVSEIVTNAIQASRVLVPPNPVRLWQLSDRERLLIMVWDASPDPPILSDPGAGEVDEGGRGLMLVEAIAAQWSWYPARETGGKVVWALCADTEA